MKIEICEKCARRNNSLMIKFGSLEKHMWYDKKKVLCWPLGAKWSDVEAEPPKECPYYLEHILEKETDNEN